MVGTFQAHQVFLIVNRSARGTRLFEIHTQQGSYEISADRMHLGVNHGPIVFWIGEEPVAAMSAGHALSVVDRAAQVGQSGG